VESRGQIITFGYDELNRLKTKYSGSSLVLTNYYDDPASSNSTGRISKMVDSAGQTTYNYDNIGRATSTTRTIDGTAYHLEFSYLNSRLNSITYPDNETIAYTYDAGYLKGVTGYISYSNFDAIGRSLNASYGAGGASSLYTFYPDTQRLHTLSVVSPSQGLLIDNSYGYDNKGNITGITDNLNKTLPTNFSSENYTLYPGHAHLVGSTGSGRTFAADANGNITNDGLRSITYNYDNMPTAVNTTSFVYDGNMTRLKKSSPGRSTIYIDKLYECTNGLCAKFIFAGDTRIAMKTGTEIKFYHPDHQGSTSVVTDAVGNKIDELSYLPFGETRTGIASSVSHRYTGQELDGETGLYNYNARLYDPETGRFLTADSIVPDPTNPQSLNRYSYVLNNPTNLIDPTGHSFWKKFFGGVETVVGAVMIASNIPGVNVAGGVLMGYGVTQMGGNSQGGSETTVATYDSSGSGGRSITNSSTDNGSNPDNNVSSSSSNDRPWYSPSTYDTRNQAGIDSYPWYSPSMYNTRNQAGINDYQYISFSYGGVSKNDGINSSFALVDAVRTATVGGYNAAQVAIQRAGSATRGIASNGPPVAQATLAFAAYTVTGPFVGPWLHPMCLPIHRVQWILLKHFLRAHQDQTGRAGFKAVLIL
jgi:RHS repeat-associated protein